MATIKPTSAQFTIPLQVIRLFFLPTLLALANGIAHAEWKFLTTDGKGNTVYFDPETVSRSGSFAKVWVLLDAITAHETLEGSSFLSSRTLHQYDCAKKRFRFLAFALFSGKMGTGQLVATDHYLFGWERIPSKGSTHRLLELVCRTSEPQERFAGP
ncbi:MAG TPA: surface-adhesin E family protein [Nitrospira sp.]|nr:surface-adhesin E family protein [Nitrospira sp.]